MRTLSLVVAAATLLGQTTTAPNSYKEITIVNRPKSSDLEEMVGIVKAVADISRIFVNTERSSIVLGGPEDRVAMAVWLIRALDKPEGWQPSVGESADSFRREFVLPAGPDRVTRIEYLKNQVPIFVCYEIAKTLIEVAEVRADCRYDAIGFRGTRDRVGLAEWLLEAMDKPITGKAPPDNAESTGSLEYRLSGDRFSVARIYYLANLRTSEPVIAGSDIEIRTLTALRTLRDVAGI